MTPDALFYSSIVVLTISLVFVLLSRTKSLFAYSRDNEVVLLVDIGNGEVTSALSLHKVSGIPEILESQTEPYAVVEKIDSTKLIESMASLVDKSVKKLLENSVKNERFKGKSIKIKRIMVSFSAPWFAMKTKHILIDKEETFVITKDFINEITKKERDDFESDLAKVNPENTGQYSIIETSILHTKINGYAIDNSINKKTKKFEAYVCMSAVPDVVEKKVVDILIKHTHALRGDISLHSFPVISFSIVRDHFSNEQDFILADVTGEVTDLTLVTDGKISVSTSLPFGRNTLIRIIAQKLCVSTEIAESNLNMYMRENMSADNSASIENAMQMIEKEWAIYLEDTLHTLSPDLVLPKNLYLTASDDVAPLFVKFFKLEKSDATGVWRKKLVITHIDKEKIGKICVFDKHLLVNEFVGMLANFNFTLQNIQ